MTEDDEQYHLRRAAMCRQLAAETNFPQIARIHTEMAERHESEAEAAAKIARTSD